MNHFESVGGLLRKPEVPFDTMVYSVHINTPIAWNIGRDVYNALFDVWVLLMEGLIAYDDYMLTYFFGDDGSLYYNSTIVRKRVLDA